MDQRIDCSITCYNTDIFKEIEEKLFEKFPELKHKEIYFLVNGMLINRLANLEKNKIKNGKIILININE